MCVRSIAPDPFICRSCGHALAPQLHLSLSKTFSNLFKAVVLIPIHRLLMCCSSLCAFGADWRDCFSVLIGLGISSALCCNDPCWEVLWEQIWRRYPVNKQPAETSCEQLCSEMCDFQQGLLVPDSWRSEHHRLFWLLLNVTTGEGLLLVDSLLGFVVLAAKICLLIYINWSKPCYGRSVCAEVLYYRGCRFEPRLHQGGKWLPNVCKFAPCCNLCRGKQLKKEKKW